MSRIAVDDGAGRERVAAGLLAVERLADAAVVLLALDVAFAVLEEDAFAVGALLPIVAVVGVEVAFIEAELGQQDRVARQLVVVVEQLDRRVVDHDEEVEVVCVVAEFHLAGLLGAEVVDAFLERVPHDAVAARRPVERRRRAHTAVGPAVGVLDGDLLAAMRETAVLHTAAVEVLVGRGFERQGHFVLFKEGGGRFFQHGAARLGVGDAHQARLLVDQHGDASGRERETAVGFAHGEAGDVLAGLGHEDFGLGFGLGVTHGAALGVLEEADDVVAIEVEQEALSVGQCDFGSRRSRFLHSCHLLGRLFDACGGGCRRHGQ